ncbi:MAG TPA: hypothetical protein VNJ09_05860, partial [Chthonomonadales bacterium]|nr:hypothetical protein [Chthonomonadales bacterium]
RQNTFGGVFVSNFAEWYCELCGERIGSDIPPRCARCERIVCPRCVPLLYRIFSLRRLCRDCVQEMKREGR